MHQKKERRRSLCVYVRSSRLGDVTRRKQICPLSFSLGLVITEALLSGSSSVSPSPTSASACRLSASHRCPSKHPWPSPQLSQTPHRFLHPPVCLFCCLWQGHAHYSTFSWLHATTTFSLHLNLTSLISLSYMSDPVVSIFCPFCLTYDLKNLLIL